MASPKSGEFQDGKLWFIRKGKQLTLGLTNSGLDELGDPETPSFPEEGQEFASGDLIFELEGSKGTLEVLAPASGTVMGCNERILTEPGILSEDPIEEGWLIQIEIENPEDLSENSED